MAEAEFNQSARRPARRKAAGGGGRSAAAAWPRALLLAGGFFLAVAAAFATPARPESKTQAEATAEPSFSDGIKAGVRAAIMVNIFAYGGQSPVPGAIVGVFAPGRGSLIDSVGVAALGLKQPITPTDHVRIGSNTKTFVVTVLLQLVDEGRLSLDDPISHFPIKVKVPNGDKITLRQLMQMRSGLLDLFALPAFQSLDLKPTDDFDVVHWTQLAVEQPALFPPGSAYNYSNTNYMLLGMVVEAVTGDSVQNEIEKRLLKPYGLGETSFPISDPEMPKPFAHGYRLDAIRFWEDITVSLPPSVSWAAGAMISDLEDMKIWVKAYVTGETNKPATQKERLTCVPTGSGEGGFGLGVGCSAGWYGYTGGIPGYQTAAYYLPSAKATLIVLVNCQSEPKGKPNVANAIVRDIARVVFPDNVPFDK